MVDKPGERRCGKRIEFKSQQVPKKNDHKAGFGFEITLLV